MAAFLGSATSTLRLGAHHHRTPAASRHLCSRRPQGVAATAGDEPLPPPPPRASAPAPSPTPPPRPSDIEPVAREKLWAEIRGLETSRDIAVKAQRFADAATIRDEIAVMQARDPHVWLSAELERAVAEERFDAAAQLRDELKTASPPPSREVVAPQSEEKLGKVSRLQKRIEAWVAGADGVQTVSETTHQGIRIQMNAFYIPEKSNPQSCSYVFGYKVRVSIAEGASSGTAQLIRRHWKIQQLDGEDSEVRGNGVVGEQPVLEPGDHFDYLSACPLHFTDATGLNLVPGESRVVGRMNGEYTFATGPTGSTFIEVPIDPIYFILPAADAT